jgi:hypothetical protein
MLLSKAFTCGLVMAVAMVGLGVGPAYAATATPSATTTSYSFVSSPGDWIGGGASAGYTPPNSTFYVIGNASILTVWVVASTATWAIDLSAPSGEQLHPGNYHDAERGPVQTGRAPGLSVSVASRGCNQVYGQFAIDQIAVDASGNIATLEATFTQECESAGAPPLSGIVKWNAAPLSYSFSSDPGDYIGQGLSKSYFGATTLFGLTGTTSGVTYTVSGLRDQWTVRMAPPIGGTLKRGSYKTVNSDDDHQNVKTDNHHKSVNAENNHARLRVSGDGRACETVAGDFTVDLIQTDGAGTVTALTASFNQHCEGTAAALHGMIAWTATTGTVPGSAGPTAPVGVATSQTSYSFVSSPGDRVGRGASSSYTPANSTITIVGNASVLMVRVRTSADTWSIRLAAPSGEQLHPGTYHDAERVPFRTGRAPGIDVSNEGRRCKQVYGQFAIDQIAVDSSGNIATLDASFTQECNSAEAPPLTGTVKWKAAPLRYSFTSDPGDYIGQGVSKSYYGATTRFRLRGRTSEEGVEYAVSGLRDDWTVRIQPPHAGNLAVGMYNNAQRSPTPTSPGLSVYGDGRGCNNSGGDFVISEIETDSAGYVIALRATFNQHCENGIPALHGQVSYLAG